MKIIIATVKPWNTKAAQEFQCASGCSHNVLLITEYHDLVYENIKSFAPDYIFFPHWSKMIPAEIYDNFECVVFHMTDLPFGRGGSPLQNLIERGIYETKLSAIRVCEGCDTGDIYMKQPLSLHGSAEEIYIRASQVIFEKMIPYIIENRPVPEKQQGDAVSFKRRTPEMSELSSELDIAQIYDRIRMLDAPGYPNAFIEYGEYRLSFSRAKLAYDGIIADVKIERKK